MSAPERRRNYNRERNERGASAYSGLRLLVLFHTRSHVPGDAGADDLTFAATETELKRIRSKMSEWYGVKVRGTLGTGRRDVREIEIQRGNLRWTDQGLEKGTSSEHRVAQMEGMGVNEESKMVNSAAVKLDQIGQEDDEEMVEGTEETRFSSLAATLYYITGQ